ncbi:MAG TPA: 16S rRNA (cytosine(1402)-N(4))-methyltransferase RsmH [Gammaproteobacteria bacterium]|nr:16S rRNA (cytosine(1402)-N(4))-methyltransferase RsmH [Gammaproteobacteria bacterium]
MVQGHLPVLKNEVLQALAIQANGIYIDVTYGRGGHSRAILQQLGACGRLLVMDRDPDAITHARQHMAHDARCTVLHARFSQLTEKLRNRNLEGRVSGILFDLGVSSPQLDTASRGFSFRQHGPLDMRMDCDSGPSAAAWLARVEEKELAATLRNFGEERYARRIAHRIIARRQTQAIETTDDLSALVAAAVPSREPGKHPATRTFQAIRMQVNQELQELEAVLPQTLTWLRPGGRLAVISFHSLEDRLVKRFVREQAKGDPYPPDLPVRFDQLSPALRLLGKPLRARDDELECNPRARSAVLRVAERLPARQDHA